MENQMMGVRTQVLLCASFVARRSHAASGNPGIFTVKCGSRDTDPSCQEVVRRNQKPQLRAGVRICTHVSLPLVTK